MSRTRPLLVALLAIFVVAAATSGAASQESSETPTIVAMLGPDGAAMGTVVLTEGPNGVLVQVNVNGLSPGGHGFHIHTVGACTPDFTAAGGHFNPGDGGHGFMHDLGPDAGDLPNIYAAADGTARADFFTASVTLNVGPAHSVFDADGSAIIIHAKPDSYGEDAGAGDRVACGLILLGADAGDGGPTAEMPTG